MTVTTFDHVLNPAYAVGVEITTRLSVERVQEKARKAGIDNPHALALEAGIAYNTAKRFWYDDPKMTRIEGEVLIRIATVLKCNPGDLITVKSL